MLGFLKILYNTGVMQNGPTSVTSSISSVSSISSGSQDLPAVDYSRKWWVLASVASGSFLATIDGSIVNITLPVLEREMAAGFALVEWVALAYLLTVGTLMLMAGRLADIMGKKSLYISGFIVFTIGSALCGLSQNIGMLIAFRVFQALGAVMLAALGTAIITEAFPPQERGMALGIGGLMVSIGLISGPSIGGLILGVASWRWIFFVNLPIGIIGTMMVWTFVPAHRPGVKESFDFLGAAIMFCGLLALLLGLTLGQYLGYAHPYVVGLFAGFFIALLLFVQIEKRVTHPMIDLTIFKNSLFSVNLITGFITFVSVAGVTLLMPFYLQNILDYPPSQAGLLLAVFPLGMGLIAPLAGWLSDRWGTRRLTTIGLFLLFFGYLGASTLNESSTVQDYVLRFLPLGIGMGVFQSPNNSAIMGTVSRQRLGVASGLLSLTRTVGQTIGIALIGAVWAGLVQSHLQVQGFADVTNAPPFIQVIALQQVLVSVSLLIGSAFIMSLWALWKEKRK